MGSRKEALKAELLKKLMAEFRVTEERKILWAINLMEPCVRNAHDMVAFAAYATFLGAGFILNESDPLLLKDNPLSLPYSGGKCLVEEWNECQEGTYAFLFSNRINFKNVLMKCTVNGKSLLLDVTEEDNSEHMHLKVSDVTGCVEDTDHFSCETQYTRNLGELVIHIHSSILEKLKCYSAVEFDISRQVAHLIPSLKQASIPSVKKLVDPTYGGSSSLAPPAASSFGEVLLPAKRGVQETNACPPSPPLSETKRPKVLDGTCLP